MYDSDNLEENNAVFLFLLTRHFITNFLNKIFLLFYAYRIFTPFFRILAESEKCMYFFKIFIFLTR